MTNFFEQQRKSRLRSKKIVGLFLIFLAIQFVGSYYAYKNYIAQTGYVEKPEFYSFDRLQGHERNLERVKHKQALSFSVVITIFFLITFLYKRMIFLSRPHQIPQSMGAKEIFAYNQDEKEKVYFNTVSEMSLASGVPMPKVYLLTRERALNAFTSGHSFNTADITVTQGALEKFTRDELQAVVAHEFGHIVSEDVKASVNLLSVIFSFSIIYSIGWYIMRSMGRSRSSNSKGRGEIFIIAAVVLVFGYVGFLVSRLITSMFSREREYLADSLSVQFTRYPSALASSLAKIRDNTLGSSIKHEKGQEIASICFSSPVSSFASLFASHPPIKNRIKRLDSKFLAVGSSFKKQALSVVKKENIEPKKNSSMTKTLEYMMGMGVLAEESRVQAKQTIEALNKENLSSYLTPYKIEALVYALLFSDQPLEREKQEEIVLSHAGFNTLKVCKEWSSKIIEGQVEKSLSLLDMMAPVLMDIPVYQNEKILRTIELLISSDNQKVGFENFIFCFVKKYLVGAWRDSKNPSSSDISYLLCCMSELSDPPDYEAKAEALKFFFENPKRVKNVNPEDSLEFVLGRLERLSDKNKKKLIEAILIAIRFDGKVTREEFESFRVVCDFLGVPAQPLNFDL